MTLHDAWRAGTAILLLASLSACGAKQEAPNVTSPVATTQSVVQSPAQVAKVGEEAPDFELVDLDGKNVKLSSFRGKVVVLEWFNPNCPFVRLSHTKGSLVGTAKRNVDRGVVWLAVNSGGAGKQGYGLDANRDGKKTYGMEHPILLDETGKVGHMYGATNTPHMMVISADGKLAYRGAIDNSPDGEGESPEGGKLVNYVDQAVTELTSGKPVSKAESKAYGCGVKYATP
ncbi:MAG: redoxin family protein [Polyangiaceae bacterium]